MGLYECVLMCACLRIHADEGRQIVHITAPALVTCNGCACGSGMGGRVNCTQVMKSLKGMFLEVPGKEGAQGPGNSVAMALQGGAPQGPGVAEAARP